jgi:hypothetical protein
MAKKNTSRAIGLAIGLAFLGIIYLFFFNPLKATCAEGWVSNYCRGNDVISGVCNSGLLSESVNDSAGVGERCFEGVILKDSCSQSPICFSSLGYIKTACVSGVASYSKVMCGTKQYCEGGYCMASPPTCGNHVCDSGESQNTCYLDCGVLGEWESYYLNIPADVKTKYTKCEDVFDCDNPLIQKAIDSVESQYNPKSPKEWMDSTTDWIYNHIQYDGNGGAILCGQKASDLLTEINKNRYAKGNCIDYSTLFVAMARQKGIPAYQGGICLSNSRNWQCSSFSFTQVMPQPLGYINGLNAEAGGTVAQVYGHSIAMVYNPLTADFSIVDPTMRSTLAKQCIGYSEVLEYGINQQVCFISNYEQNQYCRGF